MSAPVNLLENLNQAQRAAVTHQLGPLLVLAGAGTGKTTVLTRRIAWLIQEKLATPEQILALTFTEKAAGEMENRVDQLVAYGQTGSTIATFHSFGDQLLREHALDCGLPPEFRVLAETEQLHFLADRFDGLEELTELRPIHQPKKYLSAILKTINRAKDELVTPAMYDKVAQTLLKEAASDEEKRAAWRQKDIARLYEAYEHWKAEAGCIDFGDQLALVMQLLTAEPTIRARLIERYQWILIDEFQDTNIAQYRLAITLLGPDHNLTVVGDDDQAIYKFRGAAVSNIIGFLEDFPKATTVVLTENYRSSQAILDTAYTLIQANNPDRLEPRLKINKRLTSGEVGSVPVFTWYSHDDDELQGLVEQLQTGKKTGVWRDTAILVRSNSQITSVAQVLVQAEIPFTTSRDTSFADLPEIRGVVAFFRALVHPTDSLAHVKLAFSPYFNLEPAWILLFNDIARKTRRDLHELLSNETGEAWQRLPKEGVTALTEFRDSLAAHRQLIGTKNAGEILYQFLRERGILTINPTGSSKSSGQLSLFASQPEKTRLAIIMNLSAFFDAIKGYLAVNQDRFTLSFVDQLDEIVASIIPPQVDVGPDRDAVQILTVHAAKGLEFRRVFLPMLTSDRFPARRKTEPLELPEQLIQEILPSGDAHLEEERRLFYVALTRAKETVVLSGAARTASSTRPKKPSPFVMEALGLQEIPPLALPGDRENRLRQFTTRAYGVPAPASLSFPSNDGLIFLTPAMIETYADDPYQFYWRYVLKAPQPGNRALIYGTAIHAAIEAYYRKRLRNLSVNLDDLIERYQSGWRSEGFESPADEARQFAAGKDTLARFFTRAATEPLPDFVEDEFTMNLPGVRIRGRIDALFAKLGEIRDFKTSQVTDHKDAQERARQNIPIRIYALAYERRFGQLPKQLVLDFVEKDFKGVLVPTKELLEQTKQLIAEVVAGIRANRFDANPNNPFKDYA